eukprot:TRINITY_DN8868_c0_g1_i1.p1 TRINITY_DN8868_c0_g1~~TRINITY_DN8868_c0_g1_i1.p1  ORF type:complete len:251 (+),score=9.34 TRINITY_DN8868_c0_g1_i1:228-980(+)
MAKKAAEKEATEPKKTKSAKEETVVKETKKATAKKTVEPVVEVEEAPAAKTKKTTKKTAAPEPVAEVPVPEPVVEPAPEPEPEPVVEPVVVKKEDNSKDPIRYPIPEGVPTRYSDEELDMFKSVINESKTEALEELNMLRERLEDLNSYDAAEESMIYSMHMAEQGSEAIEKEKTYAQIQRINDYIKKLDDALLRIKEKTYGICRMCGILIAKERLLAVPITTLSASYKIHQRCPMDGMDKIEPVKGALS